MITAKITTQTWSGNYRTITKDFNSKAHMQAYLSAINLSPYSKLIGIKTINEILNINK